MRKSIIIIGAGMGGMAAGIYGQKNGFSTTIFESHTSPGGQCASWKRKGYVFDGCHFGGGYPGSKLEEFWNEVGVQPCEKADIEELIIFHLTDRTVIHDYCNIDRLQSHFLHCAPEDARVIREFINGIKLLQKGNTIGRMMFGSWKDRASLFPTQLKLTKFFKYTLESYSRKF